MSNDNSLIPDESKSIKSLIAKVRIDQYKTFIKANLALILSSGTIFIAISKLLFNFFNYIRHMARANYFNIDMRYIDIDQYNNFVIFITTLTLTLIIAVVFSFIYKKLHTNKKILYLTIIGSNLPILTTFILSITFLDKNTLISQVIALITILDIAFWAFILIGYGAYSFKIEFINPLLNKEYTEIHKTLSSKHPLLFLIIIVFFISVYLGISLYITSHYYAGNEKDFEIVITQSSDKEHSEYSYSDLAVLSHKDGNLYVVKCLVSEDENSKLYLSLDTNHFQIISEADVLLHKTNFETVKMNYKVPIEIH